MIDSSKICIVSIREKDGDDLRNGKFSVKDLNAIITITNDFSPSNIILLSEAKGIKFGIPKIECIYEDQMCLFDTVTAYIFAPKDKIYSMDVTYFLSDEVYPMHSMNIVIEFDCSYFTLDESIRYFMGNAKEFII